jgi:hypothetical protein
MDESVLNMPIPTPPPSSNVCTSHVCFSEPSAGLKEISNFPEPRKTTSVALYYKYREAHYGKLLKTNNRDTQTQLRQANG